MLPPKSDTPGPESDGDSHLANVYRDYSGLGALILRRVRDPEVAADIIQDAVLTTLQKLRSGDISRPENVRGYLYHVALNHLRNFRRKDKASTSSGERINELPEVRGDPIWEQVGRPQWALAARQMLDEMPVRRDREVLIRFYLLDEQKQRICQELGLSQQHFNRVMFRARNRFRQLLKRRGIFKADLLAIITCVFMISGGGLRIAGAPAHTSVTEATVML
jgi:RNA polymerase sigma-70 factor, ECF subfamily